MTGHSRSGSFLEQLYSEILIKNLVYVYIRDKNTELRKMSNYTERTARNRIQVIRKLGCKCQMCGFKAKTEMELAIFDIHHIQANNGEERTRDVLKNVLNGKTENYMLLCANCHKIANILDGTAKGTWTSSIRENVSDLLA